MPFRIGISGFKVVRNSIDAKRTGLACGIFCLTVVLFGCERSDPETRGDREAKSGHFDAAINWYEAALGQGDKVAVHKKMAEIFAYKLKDPPSAAYHYRRIVALNPSREKTESARNSLRKLENTAPVDAAQAKSGPPVKPLPPPSQAAAEGEKQGKAKARTYVVQSGDTLTSISRKIYQTPSRWKDILDANQNQLPSPDDLKAGQTIILP
jgi:LysM repeat protein